MNYMVWLVLYAISIFAWCLHGITFDKNNWQQMIYWLPSLIIAMICLMILWRDNIKLEEKLTEKIK